MVTTTKKTFNNESSEVIIDEVLIVKEAAGNQAPNVVHLGNQAHVVDTSVSISVVASDPEGDPLAYGASGLPPGLSIDPTSGEISGTLTTEGNYDVTVSVNDGRGGVGSTSFTWLVTAGSHEIGLATLVVTDLSTAASTTVFLGRSYASMVAVVSLSYDESMPPLASRIDHVQSDRFDLQLQRLDGSSTPISGITAHVMAVEEGVYTIGQHGVKMEAVKFTSTVTDDASSNWVGVSRTYANSYGSPVVLGQVMSSNDPDWSVFWASNGSRGTAPTSSSLYVGKNVAEDPNNSRANETIGYIVFEAGNGSIEGIEYEAGLGSDTVQGIVNSPPYTYNLSGNLSSASVAVLSSAAMDGNNGGWPVLYGASPLSTSALQLVYDEDQLADSERSHTTEQVAYVVFDAATISSGESLAREPVDQSGEEELTAREAVSGEQFSFLNRHIGYRVSRY